jgi:TonB family protein
MYKSFFDLMLCASLVGCTASTTQRAEFPVSQESVAVDRPTDAGCDFSAYSTVRIEQFARGAIIKRVQPDYPPEAIQAAVEGRVSLKVLVNEKGLVEKACAFDGAQQLRRAAEKAALQWKFKPGYGLAFIRPKTEKNPKNFAEAHIVFEFKLDKTSSKGTTAARP